MTMQRKASASRPPRKTASRASSDIIGFANSIDGSFLSIVFPDQRESSFGKLLTAAVECFARNGYHGTSTRDIAREARMSSAALYVHFRTKNELLYKIALVMARSMLQDLRDVDKPDASPAERLAALIRSYVRCIVQMNTAVRVATFEFAALNKDQQRVLSEIRAEVNAIITSCLEAGCESGDFRIDDIPLMRLAIMSLCITVCQWYRPDRALAPEELADEYAAIVLRMVGAANAA